MTCLISKVTKSSERGWLPLEPLNKVVLFWAGRKKLNEILLALQDQDETSSYESIKILKHCIRAQTSFVTHLYDNSAANQVVLSIAATHCFTVRNVLSWLGATNRSVGRLAWSPCPFSSRPLHVQSLESVVSDTRIWTKGVLIVDGFLLTFSSCFRLFFQKH